MTVYCFHKNLAKTTGFYFYGCTVAVASTPTTVGISNNYTVTGHHQDNCGFPQSKLAIML